MSDQHEFIKSSAVRKRYGGVSAMWLDRKLKDPRWNFPKPQYFGRERYWRVSDLIAWEQQCATNRQQGAKPTPPPPPKMKKAQASIKDDASSTPVEPAKKQARVSRDKRKGSK